MYFMFMFLEFVYEIQITEVTKFWYYYDLTFTAIKI